VSLNQISDEDRERLAQDGWVLLTRKQMNTLIALPLAAILLLVVLMFFAAGNSHRIAETAKNANDAQQQTLNESCVTGNQTTRSNQRFMLGLFIYLGSVSTGPVQERLHNLTPEIKQRIKDSGPRPCDDLYPPP